MNEYIKLGIWVAVIGAAFAFCWRKGYLAALSVYVQETKEELRKCSWPSTEELKGSTGVVLVAIVLLGGYTLGVDLALTFLVKLITAS